MRALLVLWLLLTTLTVAQAQAPLTPEEKTKIERVNLLGRVHALETENAKLREQLRKQQIDAAAAEAKKDIESARPGFLWDPATGTFSPAPTSNGQLPKVP